MTPNKSEQKKEERNGSDLARLNQPNKLDEWILNPNEFQNFKCYPVKIWGRIENVEN